MPKLSKRDQEWADGTFRMFSAKSHVKQKASWRVYLFAGVMVMVAVGPLLLKLFHV